MADFARCLITGATGFVGSHLTRRMVKDGKDVHVLVRRESKLTAIQDILHKITLHRIDSTTSSLINAVKLANPDVVFHLAALFKAVHTPDDLQLLVDSNITFTAQLLEAMKQTSANVLINTGTSWQHYKGVEYDPVCFYAATKQAAQDIITFYCNAYGVRAVTLKLFDTYGPSDTRKKLFDALHTASISKEAVPFSAGEQLLDLVYIDDVVDAFNVAANQCVGALKGSNDQYCISSGRQIQLRAVADLYSLLTGRTLNIQWGARLYRHREVMCPFVNGNKLQNWTARFQLEKGIQKIEKLRKQTQVFQAS